MDQSSDPVLKPLARLTLLHLPLLERKKSESGAVLGPRRGDVIEIHILPKIYAKEKLRELSLGGNKFHLLNQCPKNKQRNIERGGQRCPLYSNEKIS